MKSISKTVAIAAVAAVTAFAIAGCSGGGAASSASASAGTASASASAASTSASASSTAASASGSSSSLFSNDGWPQNEITADVPVPGFSVEPSSVSSTDTMVSLSYDNVPEGEVSAFVEAVKAAGFTYSASEQKASSSYSYSARNADDILQSTNITIGYSSTGSLNISVTNARLM